MESRSRDKKNGTRKVSEKLVASIQNGNYYEAHQLCKTLYQRYRCGGCVCVCILKFSLTLNTRYKSQREYEAIDVLHNGTVQMLKNSQVGLVL